MMQLVAVGAVFIWSGFVRSGLGFGGAVLSLPFLLLIHDDPIVFLPLIAIHLLIFSAWIALTGYFSTRRQDSASSIDWRYLKIALAIMFIPKLVGVFGLLTMPGVWMSTLIFIVVFAYAIGYVFNKPFKSNSRWLDAVFLMVGGYISGASLIGAPLIVAVFAAHVSKLQLRDTLFVLWFILVGIKALAFLLAGVDFQWMQHLWLLPLVTLGHLLGQMFHRYLVRAETAVFYRVMGGMLLVISTLGLVKTWLVL